MAQDIVCGMEVPEHQSNMCMDYEGMHYCFCSEECLAEFRDNPDVYAEAMASTEEEM